MGLRAIIRRSWRDAVSGANGVNFITVDFECEELQNAIGGGYGESGYDLAEVVGIERLPDPKQ